MHGTTLELTQRSFEIRVQETSFQAVFSLDIPHKCALTSSCCFPLLPFLILYSTVRPPIFDRGMDCFWVQKNNSWTWSRPASTIPFPFSEDPRVVDRNRCRKTRGFLSSFPFPLKMSPPKRVDDKKNISIFPRVLYNTPECFLSSFRTNLPEEDRGALGFRCQAGPVPPPPAATTAAEGSSAGRRWPVAPPGTVDVH